MERWRDQWLMRPRGELRLADIEVPEGLNAERGVQSQCSCGIGGGKASRV